VSVIYGDIEKYCKSVAVTPAERDLRPHYVAFIAKTLIYGLKAK